MEIDINIDSNTIITDMIHKIPILIQQNQFSQAMNEESAYK